MQGAQVQSLVRELDSTCHNQKFECHNLKKDLALQNQINKKIFLIDGLVESGCKKSLPYSMKLGAPHQLREGVGGLLLEKFNPTICTWTQDRVEEGSEEMSLRFLCMKVCIVNGVVQGPLLHCHLPSSDHQPPTCLTAVPHPCL